MDYRLKENRKESFIKWFSWSLTYKDCDPSIWLTNYLNKRFEHNSEQRLWLCWLYGNTYQLPTAWVLFNEYPDFELATYDRIDAWNTENYHRLRYQVDTKWSKGHLPNMFKSYHEFVGDRTQREALESYLGDNECQNFDNLYKVIKDEFYKFGRYTAWFYLQHLNHTAEIPNEPPTLLLNDYSGSRSHRNGMLYVAGWDDKVNQKLSEDEYQYLEDMATEVLEETKMRHSNLTFEANRFTMETALCSFKKIFRSHHGRYLGYYLDRQSEEIQKVAADNWNGIEWDVLWQARRESLDNRLIGRNGIDKGKFSDLIDYGNVDRFEWLYSNDVKIERGLEAFL